MQMPLSINQLHKDLVTKKYSVTELVNAYLTRINTFDKNINSFLTLTEDLAYTQAKTADRLISDLGKDAFVQYPLLGVVVAHKDLFNIDGIRTTAGSRVLENYIAQYTATAVKRLQGSGAITVGKTNLDAWGHGSSGENSDFGPTKNPWNLDYVPGGSSSGSAAAVAANFALMSTGTDTGSSVRLPASFCNLVGLKPTYGAVSRYGVIAFASSLDTIGHMTHTVSDNEKVFNIWKGADGKDVNVKYPPKQIEIKNKFTLGLPKQYFEGGVDTEVLANFEEVKKVYKKQNIKFREIDLPHTEYGTAVYYITAFAEASSNLARYDGVRYGRDRSKFGDEAKRRIMLGSYVLSAGYRGQYYIKAIKVRNKIITDFEKAFTQVDAILAPVSPTPAFALGQKTDEPLSMYLSDIFTVNANIAGIPALAIPGGFSKQGLPIGFQLMGPRFSESSLFKLGKIYQSQTDYHLKVAIL